MVQNGRGRLLIGIQCSLCPWFCEAEDEDAVAHLKSIYQVHAFLVHHWQYVAAMDGSDYDFMVGFLRDDSRSHDMKVVAMGSKNH